MKTGKIIHSLKGLIAICVGTLAFSFWLWFVLGDNNKRPFHEIEWKNQAVVEKLTTNIISNKSTLNNIITERSAFAFAYRAPADTTPVDSFIKRYRSSYFNVLYGIKDSAISSSDTEWAASHAKALTVYSRELIDSLKPNDNTLHSTVFFKTNRIPGFVDSSSYEIPINKEIHADKFLVRYPLLGFWALLIILQLTMYTLLIVWLPYKLFESYINNPGDSDRYRPELWTVIVHAVICSVICFIFYRELLKADGNTMVKPQYFMFSLDTILDWTNLGGYINAGLCIAGMLLTYVAIRKIKERVKTADEKDEDVLKEKQAKYYEVSERFTLYFTILAAILTFGTLATSSLFSGLNSLPYIKQIARSQGYSPFPPDFVYLYGIVHSAILLATYLLVKSQLNELKNILGIKDEADGKQSPFFKKVIEVLITGGPMLGPVLQSIFEQF